METGHSVKAWSVLNADLFCALEFYVYSTSQHLEKYVKEA